MAKLANIRHLLLIGGLLIYYFLVLYPFSENYHNPAKGALSDAFHYPMFFGLTVFLYLLTPNTKKLYKVLIPMILGIIMAGYTELIQPQTGRTASWIDLFNGILGTLLAGYGLYFLFPKATTKLYFLYLLTLTTVLFLVLIPAYQAYNEQNYLKQLFPTLATFETKAELTNWKFYTNRAKAKSKAQITSQTPLNSQHSLYLEANPADYVGFEFYPVVHDFSGYSFLEFQVFNPGNEFQLHIRIDDKKYPPYEKRANLSRPIKPGLNSIAIPLKEIDTAPQTKTLNLKTIHTIFFYVAKESTPSAFYLDNVVLR